MIMKLITIKTINSGELSDYADVVGGLAVHTAWDSLESKFGNSKWTWWQITHVPTGYKIPYPEMRHKKHVIALRKELLKAGDWECFSDYKKMPAKLKKIAQKILKNFQE